ncbi:MAG: hypothetical protein E4H08_09785, partial [Candidatus Atribacteria bacterium]
MPVFSGLVIASCGLLIAGSLLLHHDGALHRVAMLREGEWHAVGMRQDDVTQVLAATVSDILFLADLNEVGPFLREQDSSDRVALEQEFVAFSRNREVYRQIRIVSSSGSELLRVDYLDGQAVAVRPDDLQDTTEDTSFQDLAQCAIGALYISPLDLNKKNGVIEQPLDPVMQFILRIGTEEAAGGYLALSLAGNIIVDAFSDSHPDPEASPLLIDQDGSYIYGLPSDDGWQFMLFREAGQDFSDIFPEEWQTIASADTGQFESPRGLFTYSTLIPYEAVGAVLRDPTGSEASQEFLETSTHDVWKNVSWVPSTMLSSVRLSGALQMAGWNAFGILLLGAGSWIFARWLAIRGEKQRLTTQSNTLLESTLQRYMSKEVCHRLLDDPQRHAQLGGDAQFVAVLFVDIRGFTGFCEQRDPKEVVAVLNRTLSELVVPLRVYRGILDKYVG